MQKYLCFIATEQIEPDLQELLEVLDKAGKEVYLYTNVSGSNHQPVDVLYQLDQVKAFGSEGDQYIFLTNMKSLFDVIYRMLQQSFDRFAYYFQTDAPDYSLTGLYRDLFVGTIAGREQLHKPVYSNIGSIPMFGEEWNAQKLQSLLNQASDEAIGRKSFDIIRKYYLYNGIYYLFEPVSAEQKTVIYRDEAGFSQSKEFLFPGFDKVQYMYAYPQESLNAIFQAMDGSESESIGLALFRLSSLEKEMADYYPIVLQNTCCILEDAAQIITEGDTYRSLFLYSFMMQVTKNAYYFVEFLKITLNSNLLTSDNRFYLWHQCKRYYFTSKVVGNHETGDLLKQIYHKAFLGYEAMLQGELEPIGKEERNADLIVVFAIQFLSEGHAPTRTTLERCYTLAKLLGKKILLINTREQYTNVGELPLYQSCLGNVMPEYNQLSSYQYKDLVIPFYQPDIAMPSIPVIRDIINQIRILKPSFIFSIGDGSIVADLCGKIVPEASIGVVFSGMTTTEATFSVIGRKINDSEWNALIAQGYTKDNIIESTFTFELKEKKRKITRESLNLPADKFLLVTVGIRLDMELEDDFFEMLQETYAWGTHIVFAGNFSRYEYFCDRHPGLREHSTYIGFYDDILSLMELCDLYVNPKRLGGGFSIIEAFHEGKPGVTVNFGDISVAAGKDFWVRDYEEMTQMIKRYIEDQDFYNAMAEKARAREVIVTSSAAAMEEMINKIQNSPLFF